MFFAIGRQAMAMRAFTKKTGEPLKASLIAEVDDFMNHVVSRATLPEFVTPRLWAKVQEAQAGAPNAQ